ncbi:GntR family transcriptional regulator [Sphingobium phenoxybenzoativorans]|uniref:GntR family transcriptional regulator n=1 Tax=Sphingobium phenoxybenzoativorans TaxID=1592790 RepID=UPI000872AE14|nr:GntR family transcriptional regulator [Sphingobium phenoxybenzoativorans]
MNAGATTGRVHEALRRQIMERIFRPGERLDPALLAKNLASSATPVREALHILTGEGLVEARAGTGFHVPHLDEPGLKDLYAWSADLVAAAIASWPPQLAPERPNMQNLSRSNMADNVAGIFLRIARLSCNSEHDRAMHMLNMRLHAVRTVENQAIAQCESELQSWREALHNRERSALRRINGTYHRRRRRAAAAILRALYRAD